MPPAPTRPSAMTAPPVAATAAPPRPGPRRRFFDWLHRHPRFQLGGLLLPPLGGVRGRLPRLARRPPRGRLLAPRERRDRPPVRARQLPADHRQAGLPADHPADGHRRRGRHHLRRRHRVPDRLLHGPRRLAPAARVPHHRRPPAALGELPRPGLRLAGDPVRERAPRLGAPAGRSRRRFEPVRHQRPVDDDRLHLPLAAVHDPAPVRRPRTDPFVRHRGLGRPRRGRRDDLPTGDPAPRPAGSLRRLDLHVQPDPRRLHHARSS